MRIARCGNAAARSRHDTSPAALAIAYSVMLAGRLDTNTEDGRITSIGPEDGSAEQSRAKAAR